MDFGLEPLSSAVVLLGIVLVVSIVVGSLLMAVVSFLLLAACAGIAYRIRVIQQNLNRAEEVTPRD